MYKGNSRLVPALLVLVVIVVAIVALVAVGRALLGGGQTAVTPAEDPARRALLTTDADRAVRMSVRGPITADENFRSYEVIISPTGRRIVTYSGYDNRVLESNEYGNTTEAYAEFVNALDTASFTSERVLEDEEQGETIGKCASGRLYTFQTLEAQSVDKELWTSSCRGVGGSFKADAAFIKTLFLRQIPDSDDMLRSIDLYV